MVELLVVISIVALLMALLLPALSGARIVALETQCLVNLRGIGQASTYYANDFKGWQAPTTLVYYNVTYAPAAPPLPSILNSKGWTSTYTAFPDFYAALDYIPVGKNSLGIASSPTFLCPMVKRNLSPIYPKYSGGWGTVEAQYSFSPLIYDPNNSNRRTNHYGPYHGDEIVKPSFTYMAGDPVLFLDGASGYAAAPITMWGAGDMGDRSTFFGVVTKSSGYTPASSILPPTIHRTSPAGLFFDMHASANTVPAYVTGMTLNWMPIYAESRRAFTADYTGVFHSY